MLCLQELKAHEDQILDGIYCPTGYHRHVFCAEKKGYSGVAIYSKQKPKSIHTGLGFELADTEGRYIEVDLGTVKVASIYLPSGSSGEERQNLKFEFLRQYEAILAKQIQSAVPTIICGDFNICHQSIDIHNPIRNKNTSGFLPEEREWMSSFVDNGFMDAFRINNKEPHNYTWWSYRARAREKNLGWRIDYIMIANSLSSNFKNALILSKAIHSDHCPVLLELAD